MSDAPQALPTSSVRVDGLRIRVARGPERGGNTLVLLSPWPESIYAWLPAWDELTGRHQVVAVDLPGYGGSEGRPELMGPRAMGAFLPLILDRLGLDRPYVVGPDVGTAALLWTAVGAPDRLAGISIGGGAAAFPIQATGLLQQFIEAPDLDAFRALDPAVVVSTAVRGIPGYAVPDVVVDDYVDSYGGTRFVDSIEYVRSYPTDLATLAPLLPTITTPVTLLAARNDPFLPLTDPEQLAGILPDARLVVLERGHNAWEEAPVEYAKAISDAVSAVI